MPLTPELKIKIQDYLERKARNDGIEITGVVDMYQLLLNEFDTLQSESTMDTFIKADRITKLEDEIPKIQTVIDAKQTELDGLKT